MSDRKYFFNPKMRDQVAAAPREVSGEAAPTPHSDSLDLEASTRELSAVVHDVVNRLLSRLETLTRERDEARVDAIESLRLGEEANALLKPCAEENETLSAENARMAEVLEAATKWADCDGADQEEALAIIEALEAAVARARASRTQSPDANPEK